MTLLSGKQSDTTGISFIGIKTQILSHNWKLDCLKTFFWGTTTFSSKSELKHGFWLFAFAIENLGILTSMSCLPGNNQGLSHISSEVSRQSATFCGIRFAIQFLSTMKISGLKLWKIWLLTISTVLDRFALMTKGLCGHTLSIWRPDTIFENQKKRERVGTNFGVKVEFGDTYPVMFLRGS